MSGSGKGGYNHRGGRRRERDRDNWSKDTRKKGSDNPRYDKSRGVLFDRPKWTAPKVSTEPIPVPECPYCGKPIRDLAAAFSDTSSGEAVHFDCVISRIVENETLERGDTVTYIGGGRFGIVHFANSQDTRGFTIKKIFEWENKENRAEWRSSLADHYSIT